MKTQGKGGQSASFLSSHLAIQMDRNCESTALKESYQNDGIEVISGFVSAI
jgi:hypothetical protein